MLEQIVGGAILGIVFYLVGALIALIAINLKDS